MPIYNALDPDTHHPVAPDPRFAADLGFLGNRLPDREARVEEFFLRVADAQPARQFLLGGKRLGRQAPARERPLRGPRLHGGPQRLQLRRRVPS